METHRACRPQPRSAIASFRRERAASCLRSFGEPRASQQRLHRLVSLVEAELHLAGRSGVLPRVADAAAPIQEFVEVDAMSKAAVPAWYQPGALLTSAVKHVSTLSPKFNWVGIYVLKGETLELGPYVGAATEHGRIRVGDGVCGTAVAKNEDMNVPDVTNVENYLACSVETASELVVLIRDREDRILGQIDIDSHTRGAFGPQEEEAVKKVARELGALWAE